VPIKSYEEYKFYLKADLTSHGLKKWGLVDWLRKPSLRYQRLLRKVEYLANCGYGPISKLQELYYRIRLHRLGLLLGIYIGRNVCGPGLAIVHHGQIIISNKAVIGKNCRIHAGVNIGHWKTGAPKIGDNVYIGPGAKIIGDIMIGDGVVIGANAVVCKNFPSGVTIGGVPAKIISQKDSSEVIKTPGA
jgi:serine O-acetyltransferase